MNQCKYHVNGKYHVNVNNQAKKYSKLSSKYLLRVTGVSAMNTEGYPLFLIPLWRREVHNDLTSHMIPAKTSCSSVIPYSITRALRVRTLHTIKRPHEQVTRV